MKREHGLSKQPLYRLWNAMMQRCYNPKHNAYKNYGGRGIEVYDEWHDPEPYIFFVEAALGPKPSPEYTIDRIDNDQGYEPGNLRWADKTIQNNNKR